MDGGNTGAATKMTGDESQFFQGTLEQCGSPAGHVAVACPMEAIFFVAKLRTELSGKGKDTVYFRFVPVKGRVKGSKLRNFSVVRLAQANAF